MAEEKDVLLYQVVLDIPQVKEKAEVALAALTRLRAEKKTLDAEFKAKSIGTDAYAKSVLVIDTAIARTQTQLKGYQKTLADSDKIQTSAKGSMEQMGVEISALTAKYIALSEAERNSEAGQTLQKSIKEKSDAYKQLYSEIGKDNLNVGNYADTILNATQATQGFAGKINDLKSNLQTAKQGFEAAKFGLTGLKGAIAATGIGLLLIALNTLYTYLTKTKAGMEFVEKSTRAVGVVVEFFTDKVASVGKVIFEAFSKPGEAIMALGNLIKDNLINRFTSFGVILDSIENRDFEKLRDGLLQLFTGVTNAGGRVAAVAGQIQTAIDANEALHDSLKKLEDDERALGVARAKSNAEINQQKFTASDVTKAIEDRIAAAKRAFEIENNITQKQIALEQKRIDLIHKEGKLNKEGPDDDKLAEAQKRLYDLTAQSKSDQIKINNEINSLEKEQERNRIELQISEAQKRLQRAQIDGEATYQLEKEILDKQLQLNLAGIVEGSEVEKALRLKYDLDLIALNVKTGQENQEKINAIERLGIEERLTLVKKGSEEEFDLRRELAELDLNDAQLNVYKEVKTVEERNEKLKALDAKRLADIKAINKEQQHELIANAQSSTNTALAKTKAGTKKELNERLNQIREEAAQELIDAAGNATKEEEIWARMNRNIADARKEFNQKLIANSIDSLSTLTDAISNVSQAITQRDTKLLEDQQTAQLKSAGLSAEARTRIEEKFAARKEELDKKSAERSRKIATAQNLIATARAITEAQILPPPFDAIKTILAVAVGAAQQVVIASQQFEHGGELVEGPSHAQGGVKYRVGRKIVELEGGEGVV
ncbi:hypothetical protein GO755_39100, partial [Spirosoma sp. HMF4905]